MTCPNCGVVVPSDRGSCQRCGLWISKGAGRKLSAAIVFGVLSLPIGYFGFNGFMGSLYWGNVVGAIWCGLMLAVAFSFAKVAWRLWNE